MGVFDEKICHAYRRSPAESARQVQMELQLLRMTAHEQLLGFSYEVRSER
jgi:hypothetical protein